MIIFSDLHAHPFQALGEDRLDITMSVLRSILTSARTSNVPVLFAGDIVHKHGYVPTLVITELIKIFKEFFDVQVYAISGNHDQATKNYLAAPADSFITTLDAALDNFYCIDYKVVQIGEYRVVGIPYMASSDDFYTLLDAIPAFDGKSILLAHQTPTYLLNEFIPTQIDLNYEGFHAFDFVFLGHIHKYQKLYGEMYMVGNPCVQDEGDAGDAKGYLEIVLGKVDRVILSTPLDITCLESKQEKIDAAKTYTKTDVVDERLYSENFEEKFDAYCEINKLSADHIAVGKTIINQI